MAKTASYTWIIDKYGNMRKCTVPGEKEAKEVVELHQKEWEQITAGINVSDLFERKKMLEKTIKHYNQLQRLKPYGCQLFLDDRYTLQVRKHYSLIEVNKKAVYKVTLSAKGLPTKNIEELTVAEAEQYYEAIKKEIKELQELIQEREEYMGIPSVWDDQLFKAYERAALALRVIGELSNDVIPERLIDDYQELLVESGERI